MTKVIGILAGGGSLPREIANSILSSGHQVVIIAIEGQGDPLEFKNIDVTFVKWGQVGRIIKIFKDKGVRDIIIIGSVQRPNLWDFRTDFGFYKNLFLLIKLIKAGGDDGVLRSVIRVIEKKGFRILSPREITPDLIISDGPIGKYNVPASALKDIEFGFKIIQRLAPFDIGQSLVIENGRIISIEAAEGTDRMLNRVCQLPKLKDQNRILIKGSKPGQELRIDIPTIGPQTIHNAVLAGLSGIAVQSGFTLGAQRDLLIRKANENSIFVSGIYVPSQNDYAKVRGSQVSKKKDSAIALEVLRLLENDVQCHGVIVIRRHILALETGEGLNNFLKRTHHLQQWGGWKFRKRGTLAISEKAELSFEQIALAADLGLKDIIQLNSVSQFSKEQTAIRSKAKEYGIEFSLSCCL